MKSLVIEQNMDGIYEVYPEDAEDAVGRISKKDILFKHSDYSMCKGFKQGYEAALRDIINHAKGDE
ncbi:MAG: hypothetical protein ACOCQD_03735 [archaeon]